MTNGNDTAFAPEWQTGTEGMSHYPLTKREYFAAMAMQGIWAYSTADETDRWDFDEIAERAVHQADRLIVALNEESK